MNLPQPMRLGFCGFGAAAEYFHLPLIQGNRKFFLAAVIDPSPKRRQRAYDIGFSCATSPENLEYVVREMKLQVVVIASPNAYHYQQARACLKAGAHVLLEKPATESVEQFDDLCKLAHSKGRILVPFQNRRFDDDHLKAVAAIQNGSLGRLVRIDMSIGQLGPFNRFAVPEFNPGWRTQKLYGGGCLNDWGPHLLDRLLQYVGGRMPLHIHAISKSGIWSSAVDDLLVATYDWNTCLARVVISTIDSTPLERMRLCGTKAMLHVVGDDVSGQVICSDAEKTSCFEYRNSVSSGLWFYELLTCTDLASDVQDLLRSVRQSLVLLEATRESAHERSHPGLD